MVVVKDQLDRIKQNERLGVEAAAAVEADITALLQGKSYDHLVALQKSIQAKLTSGEPIEVEYWEGLLKKLLVWKAKVCNQYELDEIVALNSRRPSSRICMKSSFATDWSSSASVNATKLCKPRKNCWQVSLVPPHAGSGRTPLQRTPSLSLRRNKNRTIAR